MASAIGDAVGFCDADDVITPGSLSAMGKALCQYDFVACRIDVKTLNVGNTVLERLLRLGHKEEIRQNSEEREWTQITPL